MLAHIATLANALWYGKTQTHLCVVLSLSAIGIDLTPLNSDLLGPDSQQLVFTSVGGNLDFPMTSLRIVSLRRAAVPFLDCGSSD